MNPATPQKPVHEVTDQRPALGSSDPPGTVVEAPSGSTVPPREDQVQNAVVFLTHPKVRESPIATKRAFLERKGLTAAEIDEAFRRVPQPPTTATLPTPATTALAPTPVAVDAASTQAGGAVLPQLVPSVPQAVQHAAYSGPAVPPGNNHNGSYGPHSLTHPQQPLHPQQQPIRWTQVVLGAGVLAAGFYACQRYLAPLLNSWYREINSSWTHEREQSAEQRKQLTEALTALQRGQEALTSAVGEVSATLQRLQEESPTHMQLSTWSNRGRDAGGRGCTTSVTRSLSGEVADLRAELERLRSQQAPLPPPGPVGGSAWRGGDSVHAGGNMAFPVASGTASYPAVSASGVAPMPSAGMPFSGFGSPGQDGSFPGSSGANMRRQLAAEASSQHAHDDRGINSASDGVGDAPHSAAFDEIMEMVSKGITPPNVRTDIVDAPPDPTRPLSAPQLRARPKPWERSGAQQPHVGTWQAQASSHPSSSTSNNTLLEDSLPTAHVQDPGMQQGNQPAALPPAPPAQAVAATFAPAATRRESSAVPRYDFSHLLGATPAAASTSAWRPPPPPPASIPRAVRPSTVVGLPASTGGALESETLAGLPVTEGQADTAGAAQEADEDVSRAEVAAVVARAFAAVQESAETAHPVV